MFRCGGAPTALNSPFITIPSAAALGYRLSRRWRFAENAETREARVMGWRYCVAATALGNRKSDLVAAARG